ncbi:PREDICTED: serine/threonine-protein phosphatase 7 long form homolog [Nicotiana attenuata]|uniref:serine/threonine-protein phosphatase 7 long form homolog n=1 Tax=Nicotiana attenuata TaxID=49451 RepID=UPI000905A794|nr:PREDICTED: serine/threonine-protein phosphatase 7 long form homolog [Nicotiana attenuata]
MCWICWRTHSEEVIVTLPAYCTFGRHIWRASVPFTCLDIVEHHASERVFRQFGLPQPIPTPPAWHPLHYERDDRSRVDDTFIDWLNAQLAIWDRRGDLNPPPQHFPIEGYMAWYRTVSRLFIGNPVHQAEGRYVSYAGRHEALAIGLHTRGRGIPRGGGARGGGGARRAAGARRPRAARGGGVQQGGHDAPNDDVAADMTGACMRLTCHLTA